MQRTEIRYINLREKFKQPERKRVRKMDGEQAAIRLPAELKDKILQETDGRSSAKRITLRIQMDLYKELKKMSGQTGLTVTSLLIAAIWQSVLKPKNSRQ